MRHKKMNQYTGKVSIVLPTYNGSGYLRSAIDSCLKQTHQNIELIIVDDGSTDGTPDIIKSYKDKRIRYIRHPENRGLPHALNTGFEHAAGAYFTWTSDDNLYAENAIEKMLAFLIDNQLEFVYCDFYTFENDDLQNRQIKRCPDNPALEKQDDIGACFLYSRKVKEAVGAYDPKFELVEDYDYWIRVSQKFRMGHLYEPVYFYRTHMESLTSHKYFHQKISEVLLRLSKKIINVDQAVNDLNSLFAGKYWGYQSISKITRKLFFAKESTKALKALKNVIYSGYEVYKKINKVIVKIFVSRKIRQALEDFTAGKQSLADTKLVLGNILMGTEHTKQ